MTFPAFQLCTLVSPSPWLPSEVDSGETWSDVTRERVLFNLNFPFRTPYTPRAAFWPHRHGCVRGPRWRQPRFIGADLWMGRAGVANTCTPTWPSHGGVPTPSRVRHSSAYWLQMRTHDIAWSWPRLLAWRWARVTMSSSFLVPRPISGGRCRGWSLDSRGRTRSGF